jgi:cytochrome c oxidase cbb3-type subunit 3
MLPHCRSVCVITAVLLSVTPAAWPQNAKPGQEKSAARLGKQIFASNCAACHGIDGKGSERAPNIADALNMKRRSDGEIIGIIQDGIPGTGMPAFHALNDAQIQALVAHLRALEGPSQAVATTGNAQHGRDLFFGKGGCSRCHMIAGEGGMIAQDLSEYARDHNPDQVKVAILHPAAYGRKQWVRVILRSGPTLEGRIRNEDNFSIQLQTSDGAFHLLDRSDVEKIESAPSLEMPGDYASRLSAAETDDLIAYLTLAAGTSKAARVSKPRRGYEDEP